jgi:hypothetical protein
VPAAAFGLGRKGANDERADLDLIAFAELHHTLEPA